MSEVHKNDARCQSSAVSPALSESVEPIVQELDDALPLGRREFFLGHVGAIFDLLLEGIQLGILRVRAVTEEKVLGAGCSVLGAAC